MSNKGLTFEEKKELLEAMSSETPWVRAEVSNFNLSVKKIVKHCAQEVYGRNLSKMFEAHIVRQLREDGILPPVGVPLVELPNPGVDVKDQGASERRVSGLAQSEPEPIKKKLTRITLKKK